MRTGLQRFLSIIGFSGGHHFYTKFWSSSSLFLMQLHLSRFEANCSLVVSTSSFLEINYQYFYLETYFITLKEEENLEKMY